MEKGDGVHSGFSKEMLQTQNAPPRSNIGAYSPKGTGRNHLFFSRDNG